MRLVPRLIPMEKHALVYIEVLIRGPRQIYLIGKGEGQALGLLQSTFRNPILTDILTLH